MMLYNISLFKNFLKDGKVNVTFLFGSYFINFCSVTFLSSLLFPSVSLFFNALTNSMSYHFHILYKGSLDHIIRGLSGKFVEFGHEMLKYRYTPFIF